MRRFMFRSYLRIWAPSYGLFADARHAAVEIRQDDGPQYAVDHTRWVSTHRALAASCGAAFFFRPPPSAFRATSLAMAKSAAQSRKRNGIFSIRRSWFGLRPCVLP